MEAFARVPRFGVVATYAEPMTEITEARTWSKLYQFTTSSRPFEISLIRNFQSPLSQSTSAAEVDVSAQFEDAASSRPDPRKEASREKFS